MIRPLPILVRAIPFFLIAMLAIPPIGVGSPASLEASLSSTPAMPGVSVSLCFAPVDGEGETVAHHAERLMTPGSVMKIVTSAAVLDRFGPDHRFETRARIDGPIREGHLEGNIYLSGDGDPFLVTERLWLLAHEVAVAGVRSIEGALIVDADPIPYFQEIRDREETDSPYSAPVSRLGVNFNSLTFLIRPASREGRPAAVWLDPSPVPRLSLEADVVSVIRGRRRSIEIDRIHKGPTEVWRVTGSIPVGSPPVRIRRAGTDPAMLAGGLFAGLLKREGIEVHGIRKGAAPESSTEIATLQSLPLGVLIRWMNVWSNNFMADLLFAGLNGPGTEATIGEEIADWLGRIRGNDPRPVMVDGSGLSAANRISAGQVVDLLLWAERQEPLFADLYASLARPKEEGTLRRRFHDRDAPAMRAKTGTLGDEGVSGIAGYIDHPREGRYAFCIFTHMAPRSGISIGRLRLREEAWLTEFVRP